MEYSGFIEYIIDGFKNALGEDVHIKKEILYRNNGEHQLGLCIHAPGKKYIPVINLTNAWNQYLNGFSKDDLLTSMLLSYHEPRPDILNLPLCISSYDEASGYIILKLINKERNKDLLPFIPHREYLDFAIVYSLFFDTQNGQMASALVRHEHMKFWKTSEEQLYSTALQNSLRLLPAKLAALEQFTSSILLDDVVSGEKAIDISQTPFIVQNPSSYTAKTPIYVLTNEKGYLGASSILYPHVLNRIHQVISSDFWLIPGSIHELILISKSIGFKPGDINCLVEELNSTTIPAVEILSDHVYEYSLEDGLRIFT